MEKVYERILDSIPETIDFSFITVKNETIRTITLENPSESPILYKIEMADTYKFEPNNGILKRLQKLEIKIKIVPEQATVVIANAKLTLDEKICKVFKLSSIAKYPYLVINKSMFDFGNVLIGKSKEMEIIITNPDKVPAKFLLKKKSTVEGRTQEQFYMSAYRGEIPPQASFLIKAKYVSTYPNYFSYNNFEVKTIGGNRNRLSCMGNSLGLNTYISTKSVNFGSLELTAKMTKLIRLYNDSEVSTTFQFFHVNEGPFLIQETEGVIEAKSNVRVNISFKPNETIIYYTRVLCLIKNHFLFSLDLYGSCHNLLNKTKTLEQKHIDIFRYKIGNGFYFNTMGTNLIKEFDISTYLETVNKTFKKNAIKDKFSIDSAGDDTTLEVTNQTQLHKEMFWEINSCTRLFYANQEIIDFRFVEYGKVSEPFILTVFNNSTEKMKLKWILDKPINLSNLIKNYNLFSNDNLIFIVSPEEAVVNKKSSTEFKVYFKPNKLEFYFFTNLVCLATLMTSYERKELSEKAFELVSKGSINNQSLSTLGYKTNLLKSLTSLDKQFEYFDPPIPLKVSVVGHSFPPNSQIFMPMMEVTPDKEIIFPPSSLFQSGYQTLTIRNNSDTPLYFKFITDTTNIFRVYPKCGLIASKAFNLICVEFCPKEINNYKFPLRIIFNHDTHNMHTVLLNGLCVDPLLEIDDVKGDVYFPPSFIGINTKKSVTLVNRSPIRVNVQIQVEQSEAGVVSVDPNYFDMEANQIRKVDIFLCPTKVAEIHSKLDITVGRIYDHVNEFIGYYNPGSYMIKQGGDQHDRRIFKKVLNVLGKGSDGDLKMDPSVLKFGTVKVGFYKKMYFSIFNPTICNFYVKLVLREDQKYLDHIINFDFTEGLINSFCKKDVSVTFRPVNRKKFSLKVALYAMENKNDKMTQSIIYNNSFEVEKSLKAEILIEANGDYPLIKIVDIRNSNTGTSKLWLNFNVDEANEELLKQLTEEEINFINNEKTNKKIQDYYDKLKCIKFDFGKQSKKNKNNTHIDIYLTLRNVGGVTSEFFFKFPDDISIKREIWMDPVEPTSNETLEYHVLKEKLFEIEPRKSRLEPNEFCNIRFRYHVKEKGDHRLRVIFQIVNGKPLIFELYAETHPEKKGILEILNPNLNFHYVPMGYSIPIISPIEIKNVGGIKLKYTVDETEINKYNAKYDDFSVFRLENTEGSLSPGDVKYIIGHFRPITNKSYKVIVPITYTDEIYGIVQTRITLSGHGYHPLTMKPPTYESIYQNIPKSRVYNIYEGQLIQKCGVSLEEIDFGYIEDKPSSKTFIIYNYSMTDYLNYEFVNPGFNLKDDLLEFDPEREQLEPNSHHLVKIKLIPRSLSTYEGEIEIKISWSNYNNEPVQKNIEKKENLYIRILKKSVIRDLPGKLEHTSNPNNSFIESILLDYVKEILCDQDLDTLLCERLDNQPLGLYEWTNNIPYVTHEEVRAKLINNNIVKALISQDLNSSSLLSNKRNLLTNQRNTSSQQSNSSHNVKKETPDPFSEASELAIDDKYLQELIDKMKFTIPEVNEKILLVNEDSRNLIGSILESTIYNIIAEAVYGETDLSEKTKIYFMNRK